MKLMLEMQSDKEGDKLHSHMYSLTWNNVRELIQSLNLFIYLFSCGSVQLYATFWEH